MKRKATKPEACSTEKCNCKCSMWLIPIAMIILVWAWPAELWAQITLTVLAVLGLLAHNCPCGKK